jgi:hypothetical protein
MRTKDQLKQVVERALYEPNSKAFLKREMQFVKEKYYYEHEDFLNDSLMNISEIASSETFRFNIQRNQIKQRLSKEEFIRDYYGFCIDKNEGLTFEEYFEREEPKVKQKIKDEITALEKRHNKYIGKCNKIDSELRELKNELQEKKEPAKSKTGLPERETLEQFFDDDDKYKNVIKILANEGYINPDTLIWIDKKKGHKSFAASTIKKLFEFGYLNDSPTNREILNICKNTFKIKIGIDIIKRADVSSNNFSFLKPE